MSKVCALALCVLALTACRESRWKKSPAQDSAAQAAPMPQRVAEGEGDAQGIVSANFDIDEKTGRSRANLVLRLDYFPEPRPGATNLPACFRAFPADFDLGVAVCDGKTDVRHPVKVANVDQDCYTDPRVERIAAVTPLVLQGCKKATIIVHAFQPRLKVDVEVRDVN